MSGRYCNTCRHFLDMNQTVGTCRRFPQYQTRSPNEVCGEFAEKAIAPPDGGAFLALPVVDIPQIDKKRGRPRKND